LLSVKRLLFVFCALLTPVAAEAQFKGIDFLSGMSKDFPCDPALAQLNRAKAPIFGTLYGTFGEEWTCLSKFTDSNRHRPHAIKINITNETCKPGRGKGCYDGEIYPHATVKQYNRWLEEVNPHLYYELAVRAWTIKNGIDAIANENTSVILGTGLEDNYTFKAYTALSNFLRAIWPYGLYRNPGHKSKPGVHYRDFKEVHGAKRSCSQTAQIKSQDGEQGNLKTNRKYLADSKCFAALFWHGDHQGRVNNKPTKPPKQRVHKLTNIEQFGQLLAEAN
jgi:hypothetical protein